MLPQQSECNVTKVPKVVEQQMLPQQSECNVIKVPQVVEQHMLPQQSECNATKVPQVVEIQNTDNTLSTQRERLTRLRHDIDIASSDNHELKTTITEHNQTYESNKIKEHFMFLKEELVPDNFITRLFSHGILTDEQQEHLVAVMEGNGRGNCTKELLHILSRTYPNSYVGFCRSLRDEKYFLALKKLQPNEAFTEEEIKRSRGKMPEPEYGKIKRNMMALKQDIYPANYITHLFTEQVFTEDEYNKLKTIENKKGKIACVEEMLYMLFRCGQYGFKQLMLYIKKENSCLLRKLYPDNSTSNCDIQYTNENHEVILDLEREEHTEFKNRTTKYLEETLNEELPEKQLVSIRSVTKGCVQVTFEILSLDKTDKDKLQAVLEKAVKSGYIGPDAVAEKLSFEHINDDELTDAEVEEEIMRLEEVKQRLKEEHDHLLSLSKNPTSVINASIVDKSQPSSSPSSSAMSSQNWHHEMSQKTREIDKSNIPQELSSSQDDEDSQGGSSSQADKELKYQELKRERAKYERDINTLTEQAGNLSDSDGTDEEEAGNKKKDNISDANKTQSETTVHITGGEKGLMDAEDSMKIKKNFDFLCDELIPEDIICPLFEKDVFTLNNVEELEAMLQTGNLRACVKSLLFTLFRSGSHAYSLFLECLKEQKYFPAYLQLEPKSNIQICEDDFCRGRMPKEHYDKIQCNMEYLKDELQPEHLITPLFSYDILAEDDVYKLEAITTRKSCINSLLCILLRRGPRAYGCLCKCLLNGYLHVLRKLEPKSEYYQFDVKYTDPDKKYDFKSDSSSESNSKMIRETDKNMVKYIDNKFAEGNTVTGVSNVTMGYFIKVTFRVLIRDKSEIKGEDIKAHIESGLKAGFIGPDAVEEEGFTFKHLIESDLEKLKAKMKAQNLELKKIKEELERCLKMIKKTGDGNSRKQKGKEEKSPSKIDVISADMDDYRLPSTSAVVKGSEEESVLETNEPKASTSGDEISSADSGLISTFLLTGTGRKRKKNVPVVPQNPKQARMQMKAPHQSPMNLRRSRAEVGMLMPKEPDVLQNLRRRRAEVGMLRPPSRLKEESNVAQRLRAIGDRMSLMIDDYPLSFSSPSKITKEKFSEYEKSSTLKDETSPKTQLI